MAVDYDAPRRGTEDEAESIEEVKAAAATKKAQSPNVDEDETEAAESFVLPGADLSAEVLEIEVVPVQPEEFTCTQCFLVHHRSALMSPSGDPAVCRDCA
jgi:hypothetical protein